LANCCIVDIQCGWILARAFVSLTFQNIFNRAVSLHDIMILSSNCDVASHASCLNQYGQTDFNSCGKTCAMGETIYRMQNHIIWVIPILKNKHSQKLVVVI